MWKSPHRMTSQVSAETSISTGSCWSKSDSPGELGLQVYFRDPEENQCPEARGKPVTTNVRSVS